MENYVRTWPSCQKHNPPQPAVSKAHMGTITAHYPFERISWDIMGPLPASPKRAQVHIGNHRYV